MVFVPKKNAAARILMYAYFCLLEMVKLMLPISGMVHNLIQLKIDQILCTYIQGSQKYEISIHTQHQKAKPF